MLSRLLDPDPWCSQVNSTAPQARGLRAPRLLSMIIRGDRLGLNWPEGIMRAGARLGMRQSPCDVTASRALHIPPVRAHRCRTRAFHTHISHQPHIRTSKLSLYSYNLSRYLHTTMVKALTKVVFKPSTQSTDEFTVIVNQDEVRLPTLELSGVAC